MSWKTINKVLGLAMVDKVFADQLLKEPREALNRYGIQLPKDELEIICTCQSQTLSEFTRQLMEKLGPESH